MTVKFIKLTEKLNRGDTKFLLLNVAHISHIQSGINTDTHVRMANGKDSTDRQSYYFVKETVEEIERLLNE